MGPSCRLRLWLTALGRQDVPDVFPARATVTAGSASALDGVDGVDTRCGEVLETRKRDGSADTDVHGQPTLESPRRTRGEILIVIFNSRGGLGLSIAKEAPLPRRTASCISGPDEADAGTVLPSFRQSKSSVRPIVIGERLEACRVTWRAAEQDESRRASHAQANPVPFQGAPAAGVPAR